MSLEIYGLDLRPSKRMLITGINLVIDKPNLVVNVVDADGLAVAGADVNVLSAGHELESVTDAEGTALLRFMPGIINTLTVSKEAYATSTVTINQESSSLINIYVNLYPSELRLKVVNNQNEPIEGATCRVLNAIGGSNNVLSFDGVDDYVQLPAAVAALLTSGTSATLELLIKLQTNTPAAAAQTGAWTLTTSTTSHYPWTDSVVYMGTFRNARLTCGNNSAFDKTEWHRLTITTTPGTNGWKLYQNGGLFYQASGLSEIYINSAAIEIGRSSGTRLLQGQLSDIRLWKKALSQPEIDDLKFQRLEGNETDLVGYWDFADGDGTSVIDKVNGNNGTVFGATWQQAGEDFPIEGGFTGYDTATPYSTGTTNANGLTTLQYQIDKIHGLEVTLPGKRRFIMPFERPTRGLLDWQVMLSDYLATFATDKGNILINSEPENNDSNFLISQ